MIKVQLGAARTSKDTEASSGPRMLFTIKGNKMIPSASVKRALDLPNYDAEGNNVGGENKFNVAVLGEGKEAFPAVYIDNAGGYLLGKNAAVSGRVPLEDVMSAFGLKKETYTVEGEGNPRSFNAHVDLLNPTVAYFDADGNQVEEAVEDGSEIAFYPLSYLGDVVKGGGTAEGEEESEEEDKPAKGRGRRSEKVGPTE